MAPHTGSPPPSPSNSTTAAPDPPPMNYTALFGPLPPNPGPSRQPAIIASSVFAWSVSLIFVALRFHTRRRLHILGASDWCILPALLCALGVAISAIEQAVRGAGRHSWELDPYSLPHLQRAAWYGMLFYGLSLSFTRISILLLYRRIFTYNWAKRAIEVSLAVVTVLGIWFGVSVCTACVPLQAFWQWDLFWTSAKTPVCLPYQIWWANAALHLTSDLFIMALPMPILSTLKLPRRQKYALVGVFALGFFVCIISVLRLIALVDATDVPELDENGRASAESMDSAYHSADLVYWTAAEVNAAIVCACAMTLKPLVQRWFPKLLSAGRSHRERYFDGRGLSWIVTPVTGGSSSRTGNRGSGMGWRESLRGSGLFGAGSSGGRQVRTSIHGGHRKSDPDVTDGQGRKRSSGGGGDYHLPCVEEREAARPRRGGGHPFYFHGDDILADIKRGDTDAPRSNSVSTVAGAAVVAVGDRDIDEGDSLLNGQGGGVVGRRGGSGAGGGDLASPPKAHLRLSIHVTRSVHITKTPSSPVPGEDSSDQDEKGVVDPGAGLSSSTFGPGMGRLSSV